MLLSLTHNLWYRYAPAVFLEPITIRLRPRTDFAQHLHAFDLAIDPAPAGRCDALDHHGNVVTSIWFEGQHDYLHLTTRATVETLLTHPFDYFLTEPGVQHLPVEYSAPLDAMLAPYRERQYDDASAAQLASQIHEQAGGQTQQFLIEAMRAIHERCEWIERHEGAPHAPGVTLQRGYGACRDLAVLFINLCHNVGIAARFVSGYQYQAEGETTPQLHAWAEVYLPGAGWRGYDPSAGLATADQHIALAAGHIPDEASPTQGSFRRTGARSQMDFQIDLRETTPDRASPPRSHSS